jgi:hypothetical protein
MRRIGHFALLACALPLFAAPRVKIIKLAVVNPRNQALTAVDAVVPLAELARVALDLNPPVIVTTSDAASLEEDRRILQTVELPSEIKADELRFEIDLKPNQTRIATIAYGDPGTIRILRGTYPQRNTRPAGLVKVEILSKAAAPESAPADTASSIHRTYREAIALLQQAADRTAHRFEPIIRSTPAGSMDKYAGQGFFTEGSNLGE